MSKENFIITGFDESYWPRWGSSWILSLREKAKYEGNVFVVDCGLSDFTKNKLISKNVFFLNSNPELPDVRTKTIDAIANYAKDYSGNYVYWDADVYFQESIDEIFEIISDKFIISNNHNHGFLAAPFYQWSFIKDIENFIRLGHDVVSHYSIFNSLLLDFSNLVTLVDNTWNFTEIHKVLNIKKSIEVNGVIQKVIHPSGPLKDILKNKNILFDEKYKAEYVDFIEKQTISSRRLVSNKKSKNKNKKRN